MNTAADLLADLWFRHSVTVRERHRTAMGVTTGPPVRVLASVNGQARTVTTANGEEVIAAATLAWRTTGPLPEPGWLVTLPPAFGLKPDREVITARAASSGTGLTPDHIEVTVR